MNGVINDFIDIVRDTKSHVVVVHGNVYDHMYSNDHLFSNFQDFLVTLTEGKFPYCVTYDLFHGMRVVRGSEQMLSKRLGLTSEEKKGNADMELIKALKQAKMVGSSTSQFPVNPLEVFGCMDTFFTSTLQPEEKNVWRTVFIIDSADAIFPASLQNTNRQSERVLSVALTSWSRNHTIRDNGHLIVLITRRASDLDETICDRSFESVQIRIPKPNEEERIAFFSTKAEAIPLLMPIVKTLGKITAGLSLKELGTVVQDPTQELDEIIQSIFVVKRRILKEEYGDILEVITPERGFEALGGLEKPIAKLKRLAKAMREGSTTLVSQGILFMGSPGTGKTVLAEAFAKEAGLSVVKPLDIKSMWLGESERRMSRFIDAIKDLAPVVVFIDEFDQNQGQRGGFDGDSGTSRSLYKKMLEVMSDTSLRGKVLWILATNHPEFIDPAMKRPGRCDLRIPFLPPNEHQLSLICTAAFFQYPDMKHAISDWLLYTRLCHGYNGADMIEVVRRGWEHACEDGRECIEDEDMQWACDDYRPQVSDRIEIMRMSLLALAECSSKNLLPDNWKEVMQEYVEELTGKKPTGHLPDQPSLDNIFFNKN